MADTAAWWGVGIAAISLAVSTLAFIASKASAEAARQANNFQLHTYQKEIYLAFCTLHDEVRANSHGLEKSAIEEFEEHAESSRLYFSEQLSRKIRNYFSTCKMIANQVETNHHVQTALTYQNAHQSQVAIDTLADGFNRIRDLTSASYTVGNNLRYEIKNSITIVYLDKSPWQKFIEEVIKPFDWGDKEEPQ